MFKVLLLTVMLKLIVSTCVIFALTNSFAPSWIKPDTVGFKKRFYQTLKFLSQKFTRWRRRRKGENKPGANISLHAVYILGAKIVIRFIQYCISSLLCTDDAIRTNSWSKKRVFGGDIWLDENYSTRKIPS